MSVDLHPSAPHNLPPFITAPGDTDVWMVATAVILLMAVMSIGVLYLRLHHLPEHIAHKGAKVQYQIVAVLTLIAMFTHNNLYWIAALLLALVRVPDFIGPINRIAVSIKRIAEAELFASQASPTGSVRRIKKTKLGAPALNIEGEQDK